MPNYPEKVEYLKEHPSRLYYLKTGVIVFFSENADTNKVVSVAFKSKNFSTSIGGIMIGDKSDKINKVYGKTGEPNYFEYDTIGVGFEVDSDTVSIIRIYKPIL